MRENTLKNIKLEHKMTKHIIERKIKEMTRDIKISYERIKYYTDNILDQDSEQRVEEFTNMINFETSRLSELISKYNAFRMDHAEYFI